MKLNQGLDLDGLNSIDACVSWLVSLQQDGRVVTQAPGTATSQPGQVVLQPGPSGVVGGSQLYSVPTSVQQPQYVQVVQPVSSTLAQSTVNQKTIDHLAFIAIFIASLLIFTLGTRERECHSNVTGPPAVRK